MACTNFHGSPRLICQWTRSAQSRRLFPVCAAQGRCAVMSNMRTVTALLLAATLAALCLAAGDELDKLRDRQDRPGLDALAASLHAGAEKKPDDANGWYRSAIAYSYAAEVAMEVRDKTGAQRAAEVGAADAEKAIAINGKNAEYYRILG